MHTGCGAYMGIIVDSYWFFYSLVCVNSTFYVTCSQTAETVISPTVCFFLKLLLRKQFLACM